MAALTGMAVTDSPVPDSLPATREALHQLAEHVLAAALHAATGDIGLVPDDEPTPSTLWPEHFDLAIVAARVNYGCSPGDCSFFV